jgi:ADP-heptose:LPS heptosyltransferase
VGRLEEDRGNLVRQCIHQASQFTWNKFFDRILRRVDQDLGETQQISTASQPVFLKMPRPLKVVVLKLDHRGDFLFSIPAIMKLKDKLKYVDLDIVVGEWNVDLAKKLNVFRNIYPFNFYHSFGSTLSESTKTKAQKEKELLNQLSPYDLAIDFRRPGETRFLLATVPADLKVGYKSFSEYDQALDICLDTEIDQPGVWIEDNQRNVSLQLLKLVDAIPFHGVYLPSLAPYQPEGRQIGMFPGAGEESRQWPVEFFAKVAQKSIDLRMAEKINVYFAPHEQKLAESFSALPQTKIFIGLELDEMLKSLTRNRFVLTNNSFGAHICSYLGIPSMAIYSGVETTREWAPPFGSITVVY